MLFFCEKAIEDVGKTVKVALNMLRRTWGPIAQITEEQPCVEEV